MSNREKVIDGIHVLARSIATDGWTKSKENAIFRAAMNYNDNHDDEIFVMEEDDGICINDDYYRFERQ